jgi:hypothetical protein
MDVNLLLFGILLFFTIAVDGQTDGISHVHAYF